MALGDLLQHEGVLALRAGLSHRAIPPNLIAVRVAAASVKGFAAPGLAFDDLATATGARASNANLLQLDEATVGIAAARREGAKAPVLDGEL
jgi:hypothetical protein